MNDRHLAVVLACAAALAAAALAPRKAAAEDPKAQAILKTVDTAVAAGPFAAAWPSLERYEVPAWYRDGKFGIFIHWGVYSVPAFGNEWYPRNMYRQGTPEFEHHVATYGPQSKFGYKDFIPQFKAERFDGGRVGAALQGRRREVRRAGGRAPRRLRDVRLQPHRVVRREDGAEARHHRRARRARCRPRGWCSASPATAPSTGGSSTAGWSSTRT